MGTRLKITVGDQTQLNIHNYSSLFAAYWLLQAFKCKPVDAKTNCYFYCQVSCCFKAFGESCLDRRTAEGISTLTSLIRVCEAFAISHIDSSGLHYMMGAKIARFFDRCY